MNALQNTAWAVLGGLITAAVIGLWKFIYDKMNDRVRLTAELSQPGDFEVMQHIGCACMIVTIKCVGRRVAKIGGAILALEGVDLTPALEKGFGASFGYIPAKGGPEPVLVIELVPLKAPTCSDGFILERDDVFNFALPIQTPVLHLFPTAPSQKVWIAVQYFDKSEEVILRGLQIQQTIDGLISVWAGEVQRLNVTLKFEMRVASAVPPTNTPKLIGQTNPTPVQYFPDDITTQREEATRPKQGKLRIQFPMYTLASPDGLTVALLTTKGGVMMPICTDREFAEELRITGTGTQELTVKELPTMVALHSWIENPPTQSGNSPPPFEIFFDSLDPIQRMMGLVRKDSLLAVLPKNDEQPQ